MDYLGRCIVVARNRIPFEQVARGVPEPAEISNRATPVSSYIDNMCRVFDAWDLTRVKCGIESGDQVVIAPQVGGSVCVNTSSFLTPAGVRGDEQDWCRT